MSDLPDRPAEHDEHEPMIGLAEAARQLGVAKGTLYQWRFSKKNLRSYKIGGAVKYRQSDIDAYIKAQASELAA